MSGTTQSLSDQIAADVQSLIEFYKEQVSDQKLTISEALSILTRVASTVAQLLQSIAGYDQATVRDVAINTVLAVYQQVLEPLAIPGVPAFLESWVLDPLIEREIPVVIGGIVDGVWGVISRLTANSAGTLVAATSAQAAVLTHPPFVPF